MHKHGSFEFSVENRTMVIKIFGAWNYEAVVQFGAEYKRQLQKIDSDSWACLLDLREWELVTPDVWEDANELSKLSNDSKLKHYAIICSSSLQHLLMGQHQDALTNIDTQYFDDAESARSWLRNFGVL